MIKSRSGGSAAKSPVRMLLSFVMLLVLSPALYAQGNESAGGDLNQSLVIGLIVMVLAILTYGVLVFSDRLLKVSIKEIALEKGVPEKELEKKYSVVPPLLPTKEKALREVITIKKGFDVYIKGKAEEKISDYSSLTYAVKPIDFHGISPIPKLLVKEGDQVKAGEALFYDRHRPDIQYVAPVSGEVVKIIRGEKRKIEEVVILADKEIQYKEFGAADPNELSREKIVEKMIDGGIWPFLLQRPYGIVPDPADDPKMIYISAFNTAPLAPDYDYIMKGQEEIFQKGIDVLRKLTSGGVHIGLNAKKTHSKVFTDAQGVEFHWFEGPHPTGNPGIQIHHIDPIKKNEVVWTVKPQDVLTIGRFFAEGRYNAERIVALTGCEVKNPQYFKTIQGASIDGMVKDNLIKDHVRYISGDVYTGKKIDSDGHIGFSDDMVTVILEGDQYEFFGWLLPSYPRPSVSPTFLSYFFQGEELEVNTNMHGEERPFVVTGLYEQLLPMKTYPLHLFKAILTEDFDKMEGLGIYELIEEDVALCEFACPSKSPLQKIMRQGLDMVREG